MAQLRIVEAEERGEVVAELVREYVDGLGRDLSFQGLDEEISSFQENRCGRYEHVLLAVGEKDAAMGCVALRRLSPARCELKHLYVRPAFRERGVGRALLARMVGLAREAGFQEMVLDTFRDLAPARALYRSLGFAECEAYYANPYPDAVYLRLNLEEAC